MSFSSDVKAELFTSVKSADSKHCKIAQLLAIVNICGVVSTESYDKFIALHNENGEIISLAVSLIRDLFNTEISYSNTEIVIKDNFLIDSMISLMGLKDRNDFRGIPPIIYGIAERNCCKRAYIRTAFLCCGSVNDPSKHYHIEFAGNDYDHAEALVELIRVFGIDMKIVERKNHYVVYCKEAEQIVDLLNVMSAYKSLLEFENLRVVKEVRNNVNRIVNCETANINKIVNSSVRQIEDIKYVIDKKGLGFLSENLRAVAEARLKYPDMSLKELGEYLTPPIGKSGVNHRLKKIHELAESLKGDYLK